MRYQIAWPRPDVCSGQRHAGKFIQAALLLLLAAIPAGCSGQSEAQDPGNEQAAKKKQHRNRLADETSPYLLLHAHNPVDWYPWGEEAFEKARKENKLIFLSVGYSSCHWCHVMERESFMDEEIAAILNKHFVCIKVDREERPDVDSIYMTSVQILTGRGGWPMSVFMTAEGKPFFGGTYFPARDGDRPGAPGFLQIIQKVQEFWEDKPEAIKQDSETLTRMVKAQLTGQRAASLKPLDEAYLDEVQEALASQFDPSYGGFGFDAVNFQRPKFPEPSNLFFLLHRLKSIPEDDPRHEEAQKMLLATLDFMLRGGIWDHLGGGFHRYSVDRGWQIPHFEKMLYDNGQLATVYSEAFALTDNEQYRQVVEEMLEFVLREMTGEHGEFYSALDAESEGEEGKSYRWSKEELKKRLDEEQYGLVEKVYELNQDPNFEQEYYVLQFSRPVEEIAEAAEMSVQQLHEKLKPIRDNLRKVRDDREQPLTDTKVLTSWNGLMIRGFADAGRILENPKYIEAAEKAAQFALDNLRTEDGRLWRTYRNGNAKLNAYLNDYAFLANGMLALFEATKDEKWLEHANQLTARQLELFWDEDNGGFYFTSGDHEELLARVKNPVDGAQPSGNSVAAENLLLLAQHLDKPDYLDRAQRTIRATSGLLQAAPSAAPRMAVALAWKLAAAKNEQQEEDEQ